MAGIAESNL